MDEAARRRSRLVAVDLPGMPTVWVRILRGTEQVRFVKEFKKVDDDDPEAQIEFALDWLLLLLCDDEGRGLYKPEDRDVLDALGTELLFALFERALVANGVAKDAAEGGADPASDFPPIPTSSGGSVSPPSSAAP